MLNFIKQNREYLWILILLALCYAAWKLIPSIDPRAGMDGFGDGFNTLLNAAKGIGAVALAYACKAFFTTDLTETQEQGLAEDLGAGPDEPVGNYSVGGYEVLARVQIERAAAKRERARLILFADRMGWVLWLAFWFLVFFRS
ncbi:hypothetical protein [uncultured Arenimonas sp.]|uniref:hypothetical protein n=1 Tax=uncultured Arenimonas sp. TaxID=546226 RepID=UPI0030D9B340